MSQVCKWIIRFFLVCAVTLLILAVFPRVSTAQAQEPIPLDENSSCVVCHEDLYLLHDTGNNFCLNEAPMSCVTCHGGDPTAVIKEAAHAFRDPHPASLNDPSRCQLCHPGECNERLSIFDQKAGISTILFVPTLDVASIAPTNASAETAAPAGGVKFWQILPLLVLLLGSISMGLWINKGYHPA